ncbi:MAG: ATP-binding protein [Burkholderiaceae bacterium]
MNVINEIMSSPAYREAVSAMPIGACLVSPDLHYREVNTAWADMLGYTREELVQMSFVQVTYPADRETDSELSRSLFEGEISSFTIRKRWIRKDGSMMRGTMTAWKTNHPGAVGCGFATIVPDHNQLIDSLHAQKIVHDLREILQAIQLAAESLEVVPENRTALETIADSVALATSVAQRVVDVDASPPAECSSHRAVRKCVAVLSSTLSGNVTLRSSYSGESTVAIDETKLSEVVLNLLTNARDAILGAGNIEVCCVEKNDCVSICVCDDGIGMSDDEIQQATRTFYTTKSESGTGLGLSIVNDILLGVGGRLIISSKKGHGTSIRCEITLVGNDRGSSALGQP